MGKKSKAKGNSFENRVARKLTHWASGKERPLWFARSKGSGALATVSDGGAASHLAGDLMAVCREGAFLTEVTLWELRDRKLMNVLDFVRETSHVTYRMKGWWKETVEKCKGSGKYPVICFHRTGTRYDCIGVGVDFFDKIGEDIGCSSDFSTLRASDYHIKGDYLVFMDLDQFLDWVKPWDFAHCFLGDERGKEVEENYGRQENRGKGREDNRGRQVRVRKDRRKLQPKA